MNRSQSVIALTVLVVVFVIGLVDFFMDQSVQLVPEPILKLVSAILIGVVIGLILSGFRRMNGNGRGDAEHAWDDRDRPSMRQGLDANDPGRTDVTGGDHDS